MLQDELKSKTEENIMPTQQSSLTYQDGNLSNLASKFGDRLESLRLIDKTYLVQCIGEYLTDVEDGEYCEYLPDDAGAVNFEGYLTIDLPEDFRTSVVASVSGLGHVHSLLVALVHQIQEKVYAP
jgi:hypothetical protein